MKMWAGRFEAEPDKAASDFNSSLSFDKRLAAYDIKGSMAHVKMLKRQAIIAGDDADRAVEALGALMNEVEGGASCLEGDYEDVHMAVEEILTARIGDAAKRMHTARSRNDQVALDMKMFARESIGELKTALASLAAVLRKSAYSHLETVMPGYTHMQKAQPVTLAHWMAAYIEMFRRDISRLSDCQKRLNTMPLGAGALAASTFDIDREFVARELGFDAPSLNSMDSVSDRDYLLELLGCLSIIMVHLSRAAEEIILWSTEEFGFIELSDAYSTGSSMMPQKKNPDMAELIRGKSGRVFGSLMGLLAVLKGLPLAYNKDMQEDKECVFDALDTAFASIEILSALFETAKFNQGRMLQSVEGSFAVATDLAEYLVKKGCPFRDAHFIVGRLVNSCIKRSIFLKELGLDELKGASALIGEDVFEVLDAKSSIYRKNAIGSPNPGIVKQYLDNLPESFANVSEKQE